MHPGWNFLAPKKKRIKVIFDGIGILEVFLRPSFVFIVTKIWDWIDRT